MINNKLMLIIFLAIGVSIYIFTEIKRLRHKLFAIFVIILLIFTFLSINYVFKNQDVKFDSIPNTIKAIKIYYSWLSIAFSNLKIITGNAIKMNWSMNKTNNETFN